LYFNYVISLSYISAEIDKKMDEYLGSMGVSMDGRFGSIRTMETNLGRDMPSLFYFWVGS
jgi:hypothetical protein